MLEKLIEEAPVTTINKNITKSIVNESDKPATRIEIYKIDLEDETATCKLFDENDNLITGKRVYLVNNLPCEVIADEEMEILFPIMLETIKEF